jgi:integrase
MKKPIKKRPFLARVVPSDKTDSLKKRTKQPKQRIRTKRPYSANPDSQYLTPSEIGALFKVITTIRDRAIFRVVYHRGLRSGEVGLLQLSDWREQENKLYVRREKGSESRDYRLLGDEGRALRAWVKMRGHEPGALFPSRQKRAGGLGIHRNQLDRLFRAYCRLAGIRPEKSHMHALKHSCGTHLAERGNSADVIQDWLGHKSAQSTQVYMHFSQRRRDEAWERNKDWR